MFYKRVFRGNEQVTKNKTMEGGGTILKEKATGNTY